MNSNALIQQNRRRSPRILLLRFSIRSLLLATAVLSVLCATVGRRIKDKHRERAAARDILARGGSIVYDWEAVGARTPNGPRWMRKLAGDDCVSRIVAVELTGAAVADENLAPVGQLRSLHTIALYRTNVVGCGFSCVVELPELSTIRCYGGAISDDAIANIARITSLESLTIYGAEISGGAMRGLTPLRKLRTLDLRKTCLDDTGLSYLGTLENVEELAIDETLVTDLGMRDIARLKHLRVLSLNKTAVSDVGLLELMKLPRLRTLWIDLTPVTAEGVRTFKAARGQCEVIRSRYRRVEGAKQKRSTERRQTGQVN